jgi:hypothetical protein
LSNRKKCSVSLKRKPRLSTPRRGGNGLAYVGTAERVGDYRGGNVSRPSPSPPPPPPPPAAPATAAGAGIGDLSRKLGSLEMGSNSQEPNQVL